MIQKTNMTRTPRTTGDASPIIVLGAGIIGLTTALCLAQSPIGRQHPIHIIADHWPNDPLDAKYASTIAGAHHLSFADDGDERQTKWDKRTFQVMYDEWRKVGEKTGLMVLKQTEYYVGTDKHLKIFESHPDFIELDKRPPGVDHSISFTSLTMTPLVHLNHLLGQLKSLGVHFHRHHLPSLSYLAHISTKHLLNTTAPPRAVIVCVGIGALTLGEVEDQTVFPTRGQVVKLKAPWVRSGYTRQVGRLNGGEEGERTYVIPRFDGEVIVGGTREMDDWYPYPREATSKDILKRAMEICPELKPPYQRDSLVGDGSELEPFVVGSLVGFRPSRRDGVRLERGGDLTLADGTVKVYHNYGHGGAGWQSCYGTAEDVVRLVEEDLGRSPAKL